MAILNLFEKLKEVESCCLQLLFVCFVGLFLCFVVFDRVMCRTPRTNSNHAEKTNSWCENAPEFQFAVKLQEFFFLKLLDKFDVAVVIDVVV